MILSSQNRNKNNFWTQVQDSGHFQWSKYTVLDEESDFQIKNKQFHRPEAKN